MIPVTSVYECEQQGHSHAPEKYRAFTWRRRMGQAVSLANPPDVDFWWRELVDAELVEQFG